MSSRGFFRRFGTLLDDLGLEISLIVAASLSAVCCVFLNDAFARYIVRDSAWQARVQIAAGFGATALQLVLLGLSVQNVRKRRRFSEVEASLDERTREADGLRDEHNVLVQNVKSLVEGYLASLARGRLDFDSGAEGCDRITLYAHDPTGCFIPIGRFSYNPAYDRTHRKTYPDDEGCIAQAWQNGWCFIDSFPDPKTESAAYLAKHKECNCSEATATALTMKSVVYCGYRVMDAQDREPLAVLVVESTRAGRFKEAALRKIFFDDERQFLCDLIAVLQPHFSVPSDAAKAGF